MMVNIYHGGYNNDIMLIKNNQNQKTQCEIMFHLYNMFGKICYLVIYYGAEGMSSKSFNIASSSQRCQPPQRTQQ